MELCVEGPVRAHFKLDGYQVQNGYVKIMPTGEKVHENAQFVTVMHVTDPLWNAVGPLRRGEVAGAYWHVRAVL
jgi:hypothetical protein